MMKKTLLIVLIAGGLLALLLVGLRDIKQLRPQTGPGASSSSNAASGSDEDIKTVRFVKNPTPVPQFSIKDLEGHTISPADWHGKVVLLNFWATWCAPCQEEIPDLISLQKKYQGRLQIVGLSEDTESPDKVKSFVQRNGMNYPIAIASQDLEAKFGGVMGLPTSFVVDPEGRVVQKHVGLRNPALYDTEIRALLQLPVDAKIETFDDTGQILLSNAKNATELPGVDLSQLSPDQKKAALRQLNEQGCTCGCGLTLAQCRINDTSCETSEKLAKQVVEKVRSGT
jgi:cytochrome c biogenesis protein CcmG/thiol:disulfide interchange protein DsbE